MIISLVACQPKFKTPKDTLVIGLEAAPLTLDPRLSSDAYSLKISRLLHNGLFRLDEHLEVVPDLIESYQPIVGGYRFRLRKGVLFHDGHQLTTTDIKYTLESILDSQLASPFRETIGQIESIRIRSPLEIEIVLKKPFAPILSALTIGILREGAVPEVGTGPFQLEHFQPEKEIRLIAYKEHFQKPPKINRLVFRIIPDDNLRFLELKNHRIDLLQNNVPYMLLSRLRRNEELLIQTSRGINQSYLGLNLKHGPLRKEKVRQAIAHAIDRKSIIEYHLAHLAQPATGLLSPVHWAYEREVETYDYDPKKSIKLLNEVGFRDSDGAGPRPRFSLTYKTSTNRERIGLARLIGLHLKKVGIEMKILPLDRGTFLHDIRRGNFQIYSLTWSGMTEPDIYYQAFHSSQNPPAGVNHWRYANWKVDDLTELGRRLLYQYPRQKTYSQVQKILAKELPIIPLWYEDNFAVFSRKVKGVKLRSDGSFEWATEVYKTETLKY